MGRGFSVSRCSTRGPRGRGRRWCRTRGRLRRGLRPERGFPNCHQSEHQKHPAHSHHADSPVVQPFVERPGKHLDCHRVCAEYWLVVVRIHEGYESDHGEHDTREESGGTPLSQRGDRKRAAPASAQSTVSCAIASDRKSTLVLPAMRSGRFIRVDWAGLVLLDNVVRTPACLGPRGLSGEAHRFGSHRHTGEDKRCRRR